MSSNFVIYLFGYLVLSAGVAYGIYALGLGQTWVIVALLIMFGLGIVTALSNSKRSDMADATVHKKESEAQAA